MVKKYRLQKLERAARRKTVCHSYSGAKVGQIKEKIDECWNENHQYEQIITYMLVPTTWCTSNQANPYKENWCTSKPIQRKLLSAVLSRGMITKLMPVKFFVTTIYYMIYALSITLHSLIMIVLSNPY